MLKVAILMDFLLMRAMLRNKGYQEDLKKNPIISSMATHVVTSRETLGLIGQGSYGQVYKAVINGQSGLAVKVMRMCQLPEAIVEVAILTTFRHDYIMHTTFNPILTADTIEVVLPLATTDLHKLIKQDGALGNNVCRLWGRQICEAVAALHHHFIIHGDIKSSNILVFPDHVKLTDFSMSLQKSTVNDQFHHTATTLTYRSPEALAHRLGNSSSFWDERADNWAIGCVLFEMMSGKPPYGVYSNDNTAAQLGTLKAQVDFATVVNDTSDLTSYRGIIDRAMKTEITEDRMLAALPSDISDPLYFDMVCGFLRMDSTRRFNPRTGMAHACTQSLPAAVTHYKFVQAVSRQLSNNEERLVVREAVKHGVNLRAALYIMQHIPHSTKMNDRDNAATCAQIAGIVSGMDTRKPTLKRVAHMVKILELIEFHVLMKRGDPPSPLRQTTQ
jgi:serine/threonine protein kinase